MMIKNQSHLVPDIRGAVSEISLIFEICRHINVDILFVKLRK